MVEELKMELRFVVEGSHGGDFLVRCDAGALTFERTGDQTAACTVTLDSVWLNQILRHNLPWKDFFLSLRFSVEQDPAAEDGHVLSWLQLVEPQALSDDVMETPRENRAPAWTHLTMPAVFVPVAETMSSSAKACRSGRSSRSTTARPSDVARHSIPTSSSAKAASSARTA